MKKGFTLIELLAVIVILAIISLIAIPIVLNIIEDSRSRAALRSAEGYVRAVNYKIAQAALKKTTIADGNYVIGENELIVEGDNFNNITGEYIISNNNVFWAGLCVGKYSIAYSNGSATLDKTGNYCNIEEPYVFVEPEAELLSNVCEDDSKYSETKFKIKTVEDLACFSNLVNGGKNFADKEIYLLSDIDFNNDSSYKDKNTTAYGDINGDNTTEGLKAELTTGRGFKPIGNNNNKFSGTFLGYAFTISNLMINRETTYLGLFGYNTGTISGLKLRNASVTSTSTATSTYVGGLVAYSEENIKSVSVEGSVTGNGNYVGGIAGYVYKSGGGSNVDNVLFKGTVTTSSSVGGLVGYISGKESNYSILKGVVYDSTINATYTGSGNVSVGLIAGSYNSYVTKNTRNCSSSYTSNKARNQGYDGNLIQVFTLDAVDGALDTYIGGDNDSDGYYFDYDSDGNIVLYSVERTPIQNKLKGTGTDVDPYLVRNDNDWKMASALVTQSKYFSVTSNIDFSDKKYYALGTDVNRFNGNINGNMHNISNINVYGYSNVGLFGYNQGTIEGFRFNNITVSATGEYIGGIAGRNTGLIKGIEIKNTTISSTSAETSSYIGGITGHSEGNIKSVSIEGSITGNGNYVGGIAGYVYKSAGGLSVDSALYKGTVTTSNLVGGLVGYISGKESNYSILKGVVYDSTINATYTGSGNVSVGLIAGSYNSYVTKNTRNYSSSYTSPRSRYQGYDGNLVYGLTLDAVDGALDTYIGGDNDSDGYYFDYDSNGKIVLCSTVETPIQNTLEGSGTENDPYLIKNNNDWKMASALVTQSKYFSVTSNIDFSDKKYYALGTDVNRFNGNINGNMHNISNINVYGYSNVGLFGYNQGTIEGFRFNNITVSATGEYIGGIAGRNTGLIKGIEIKNTTISSTSTETGSYIGGITGHSEGNIKSVSIEGSITGNGNYVGGIAGYVYKSAGGLSVDSALYKGTVTTSNLVGGLVGYISGKESNHSILKGVVYDSTINATYSSGNISVGLIAGSINSSSYIDRNIKNYSSSYTSPRSRYQGYDGVEISSLTVENVDGALDTPVNGEDGDGYYFDYDGNNKITLYSLTEKPIRGLVGTGTENDPYLISDADDWNFVAISTRSNSAYYSISNDIDFTGKTIYPMGTSSNKFNSYLKGNMHTISNITINGTGLFEYNQGTIEGIKFNNITVNGTAVGTGLIGTNTGTVKGIIGRNITVSVTIPSGDYGHTGGLVGINKGIIRSIDLQANVTSNKWRTGGIVGYNNATIESVLFKGSVSTNEAVGGLVGKSDEVVSGKSLIVKGVVYDSTITASVSNTNMGKTIGSAVSTTNNTKSRNVTIVGTRQTGYYVDGTDISTITLENVDGALDTTIGGDNDSDGYYFTLINGNLELIPVN